MKIFIITLASVVAQYFIILYQLGKENGNASDIGVHERKSLPRVAAPGSETDDPQAWSAKE